MNDNRYLQTLEHLTELLFSFAVTLIENLKMGRLHKKRISDLLPRYSRPAAASQNNIEKKPFKSS